MSHHFDCPGRLRDLDDPGREGWHRFVTFHTEQFAARFPHYLDPATLTGDDPGDDTVTHSIGWSAFPARLAGLPDVQRWQRADADRDEQDEYCEWVVARDAQGRLQSVTFSSEVPEYWERIAEEAPDLLVDLYHQHVSSEATLDDLLAADGSYLRRNRWNDTATPGLTHLCQPTNNLLAAIQLAADATIQRHRADGTRVEDRQELVACGRLGDPRRNSDPQIADIVNDAVHTGLAVTLADPLGLYLDGLQSAGLRTPDGADAAEFWTPLRGEPGHVVRARFEVPPERGYSLADITHGGVPLTFGAQVADKVRVRLDAVLAPSGIEPESRPCGV